MNPVALAEIAALPSAIQDAVDRADLRAFAALISRHCTFTIARGEGEALRFEGRDAIVAMTRGALAGKGPRRELVHVVGSVRARQSSGTRGSVRSICLFVGSGGSLSIEGLGHYDDDVIFEDGRWRFLERRIRMTLGPGMAAGLQLGK